MSYFKSIDRRRAGNFKFAAILFVALSFFAAPAAAQTGTVDNIAKQAASVTEFEVNGLKVLVKRREAAPTVAAGLFLRGGVRNQTPATAGIENFALAVATEAGKKFPRQALRRELSRTGSSLSSGSSRDYSAVSFASTREHFDRIWELFSDVITEPAFAAPDVERVRQQIISGLREAETVPDAALQSAQERVIHAGHPYAVDPSGTIANISRFTTKDLADYFRDSMQTSRLLLVVVGDIDADELRAKVSSTFGKLPRGSHKAVAIEPLKFVEPTVDITPRTILTNYVQGSFAAPSLKDADYFPMRVAMTILQQRIYEEVRVKRQLSYAPNAELNNYAANTGKIYVTAVDATRAVSVMLQEITNLKETPVQDQMISGMAGQFLTNYYVGQETNAAQAAELARYELIGGGWRNSFEFLNRIRAVTAKDVQNVANKYMKNLRFVVIGNPRAVDEAVFTSTGEAVVE